jgi:ketosteroid isomerase-like protein
MKIRVVVALLSCALAVAYFSVVGAPAKSNEEAQIRALEGRFMTAVNAKDINAIMSVYAQGNDLFVFDLIPPRQYVGWDAYKKDWADFLGTVQGPMKADQSALQIMTGGGDLAYSHSIQHVAAMSNGKPFEAFLRVTRVYHKISGNWLVIHEHVSVPVDFDSGKADFLSKP